MRQRQLEIRVYRCKLARELQGFEPRAQILTDLPGHLGGVGHQLIQIAILT